MIQHLRYILHSSNTECSEGASDADKGQILLDTQRLYKTLLHAKTVKWRRVSTRSLLLTCHSKSLKSGSCAGFSCESGVFLFRGLTSKT